MGWGSSTQRGGGRKVRALPRKFVFFVGFRREESGMSRDFAKMSRTPGGVQKVCAKKVRAHFSFSMYACLGCTRRGLYSAKGRVSAFEAPSIKRSLLRTLLRTLVPTEILTRCLLRTLLRSTYC